MPTTEMQSPLKVRHSTCIFGTLLILVLLVLLILLVLLALLVLCFVSAWSTAGPIRPLVTLHFRDGPIISAGEQVTDSVTAKKNEIAYNIQSANQNPFSYEKNNLKGPLFSEEEEESEQNNKFGKHRPHTIDLQVSTTKTTEEELDFSFKNGSLPFNNDSSVYSTASSITGVVHTTTEMYSTSIGNLDLIQKSKDDSEYEEYVGSEESDTGLVITTQRGIVYNIQAASEHPSNHKSNHLEGPLFSDENEDNKQKNKFETHRLHTVDQIQTDNTTKNEMSTQTIEEELKYSFGNSPPPFNNDSSAYTISSNIGEVNTTPEIYSTSMRDFVLEQKNKDEPEYEEYL